MHDKTNKIGFISVLIIILTMLPSFAQKDTIFYYNNWKKQEKLREELVETAFQDYHRLKSTISASEFSKALIGDIATKSATKVAEQIAIKGSMLFLKKILVWNTIYNIFKWTILDIKIIHRNQVAWRSFIKAFEARIIEIYLEKQYYDAHKIKDFAEKLAPKYPFIFAADFVILTGEKITIDMEECNKISIPGIHSSYIKYLCKIEKQMAEDGLFDKTHINGEPEIKDICFKGSFARVTFYSKTSSAWEPEGKYLFIWYFMKVKKDWLLFSCGEKDRIPIEFR